MRSTTLAIDRKKSGDLLEAMNAKLNALLDAEVGEDVGQMLPRRCGRWLGFTGATFDL